MCVVGWDYEQMFGLALMPLEPGSNVYYFSSISVLILIWYYKAFGLHFRMPRMVHKIIVLLGE
jgi:hypothetical protein